MKRLALYILSLSLLVALLADSEQALAKKKKKKRKKAKTTKVVSTTTDSVKVVRSPGVPNPAKMDSLKNANKIEKLKSANDALVVSFISLASGIDAPAATRLEAELDVFNKKSECGIVFEKKNWGREGELDYCILSSDPKCMADVTEMVKLKFSGNRRILIKEHAPCK
jgi:hypothetical protein